MKKPPEENQLTTGQGLPAPVCSAVVDIRDWREFRISRGLTQEAAEEALGFSRPYIARVEIGAANAGWEFAAAIVETFGVSVKVGKFIISQNT
jgi:DNA-binding XRE family transcriptional regulator